MDATTTFLADWREKFSHVEGQLAGRERRVSCVELLTLVDANDLPTAGRIEALKQVKELMIELGWRGPKVMRGPSGGAMRGYFRPATDVPEPPEPEQQPVLVPDKRPVLTDNSRKASLPQQLESVTALALEQAKEILQLPIEGASGNELRAKCSIISSTLVTQTKADEHVLRSKGQGDVLERLGKIIRQVKREMPKPIMPPTKAAAVKVGS